MLDQEIDLIYFLSPSSLAQDLDEINFIITVWDLSLRDNNEFPEIRMNNMIEVINSYYQDVLKRAMAVFVDSEIGKNNVEDYYAIDRSRVHVMPFEAAISVREHSKLGQLNNINIKKKYNLQVPYVFYPAQFWAHKNHIYLLEGLYVLEHRYGLKVGAIFSGYDEGNLAYVKNRVSVLGLEDRVRFADFVSNQEIPELYLQSIALVMPTYFGPTNLPPLEAFALKVPVLYSDVAGLRDQVGEAALLINLKDPTSMAEHIKNLMNDEQLPFDIYVINLDKDTKRLEKMEARLYPNDFKRIPGVYGNEYDCSNDDSVSFTCKYMCPKSVIGCAKSHHLALKTFLEKDLSNLFCSS
jgi:glycosyltransferase involved in cell wall biosynthesis